MFVKRARQKAFGESSIFPMKSTLTKARRRLANRLQNPRLLNISFHTFDRSIVGRRTEPDAIRVGCYAVSVHVVIVGIFTEKDAIIVVCYRSI
jgi:hypothetical protein